MAKKIKGPRILTANLLSDGMVVFLGPDGVWRASIEGAHIARSEDDAAALETRAEAAVQTNHIVDPYLIAIEETDTGLVPVQFRERRRIAGPSVQAGFNSLPNEQSAFAA